MHMQDQPCTCNDGYQGADCSECAPGFYEVPVPAWGSSHYKCVSVPGDLTSVVVPAATTAANDTTTPASDNGNGSDNSSADRSLDKGKVKKGDSDIHNGGIVGIAIAAFIVLVFALAAFFQWQKKWIDRHVAPPTPPAARASAGGSPGTSSGLPASAIAAETPTIKRVASGAAAAGGAARAPSGTAAGAQDGGDITRDDSMNYFSGGLFGSAQAGPGA